MKRTVAALVLTAMLFTFSAVACGSPEEESPKTEPGPTAEEIPETEAPETEYPPQLPEIRFDGADFRVVYQPAGYGGYWMDDVWADGLTGEIINDAVFNRNSRLQEKYNMTIVPIAVRDGAGYARNSIKAADGAYELVGAGMTSLFADAAGGLYYDWNRLSYVDADDPWWDTNSARDLSVNGRLFMMAGDDSYATSKESRMLFFSIGIVDRFNLERPYDTVREGLWTLDRMIDMVQTVSVDEDGDGRYTADDTLGLLKEGGSFFLTGCGVLYTEKDEEDRPFVSCVNERTVLAIEKINAMLNDPDTTCSYSDAFTGKDIGGYANGYDFVRYQYFATNHFLFVQNGPGAAYQFADMDPGFGILPNPKLDEEQDSYYHLVDLYACIFAIPSDVQNIEMVDIILDDWAYMSRDVIDAYYETTLKHKRFNAPDDSEMLDIVRSTTRYEISTIASIGISSMLNEAFQSGNLMSTYKKSEKVISKQIQKLCDSVAEAGS